LENVDTLTGPYGENFQVVTGGTPWSATGDVWTKTSGSQLYSFDETTGILTLTTSGGNTFDDWLALNAPATGFATDSDYDGISNGVENVFGTDPNTYSAGLTQVSATATSVTYKHKLNPTIASDVTYDYQWSTDLIEWKSTGETNTGLVTATIVPSAPVADEVTVVTTITAGSTTKLFTRLFAVK
jgi:hypothetical protein